MNKRPLTTVLDKQLEQRLEEQEGVLLRADSEIETIQLVQDPDQRV